jgi:hypothetical protein
MPVVPSCGSTLAGNHELLAHSRPVMEHLFEQVRHSQSMVMLADRRGHADAHAGHSDFLSKAERVALTCGASWHEISAAPTPSARRWPRQRGEDPWRRALSGAQRFLTCAASPILSATGELLGILDISATSRRPPAHAGLVSTAARMIENRLVVAGPAAQSACTCTRTRGHWQVAEGIVALSEDGWIVGANRARPWVELGLHMGDVGATRYRWQQVRAGCALADLLSRHHRRRSPDAEALRLRMMAALYAQVQLRCIAACLPPARPRTPGAGRSDAMRWPGWTPATPAGAPPPTRPAAWWTSPSRCSSRANRAWARSCLPAPCTPAPRRATSPLWPSTARPSPST